MDFHRFLVAVIYFSDGTTVDPSDAEENPNQNSTWNFD